ncbi:hypothetical protein GCM10010326_21690 [Streptomyces xanthochromogenes]|uniref:Histidine kinase/HSP90-like ATPase domain-containing protein n=1 Tax=Streptomyces xanthochromogenes TaxID=67384 RepID=A0ABQ2ZW48_9ACTN|nr:hypothetical protein GCM10010326_21690 [Streptomyces xanthochromogenes]
MATNAVTHGVPAGRGYLLRLLGFEETVRVEVHDSGRRWRKPHGTETSHEATTGRGLLLVAALSSEWGVLPRTPLGKVVWAEFRL